MLLVLQHHVRMGLGALGEAIEARGSRRPARVVSVPDDGVPGISRHVRGVLVLDGPMGVRDREEHPWLEEELWLLRGAVKAGVPLLGIGLGAQLLATAVGAQVTRRDRPRVGHLPVSRTEAATDDDVFAGWPEGARALFLQRHEITSLPSELVPMLVVDDAVAAFRTDEEPAYGVQFHPEITPRDVRAWTEDDDFRVLFDRADRTRHEIVATVERQDRFARAVGVALVGRFLDAVVGTDEGAPEVLPRPELVEERRQQRARQRSGEPT